MSSSHRGATVQVVNQVPDELSSQSESSQMSATAGQSQDAMDVNVTLANKLAFTNVTPSSSAQSVDKSDLTSCLPAQKVIVTSVLQPTRPLVIAQDIASVNYGGHTGRTSPKRKASESEDTTDMAGGGSQDPPCKERRLEENEESNEPGVVGNEGREEEGGGQGEIEGGEEGIQAQRPERLEYFWGLQRYRPVLPEEEERFSQPSDADSDEEQYRLSVNKPPPGDGKFPVTDLQMLLRRLILGDKIADPPPPRPLGFIVGPRSKADTTLLLRMISQGRGQEVIETLKDVSVRGRAAKNDHVLQYLALCIRSDNLELKKAAYAAIQDICRIPTHIFQLIGFIESGGSTSGWGRGLRRALCTWYNKNANNPLYLAMHVTKYWSRHNWNHRDIIRLSHVKPVNDAIGFIIRFAVKGMQEAEAFYLEDGYLGREQLEKIHKYLKAVEEAKECTVVARTVELIKEHRLVREQLRTQMLNEPEVWRTMLPDMPLTALIRNLGKMSAIKLLDDPEMVKLVKSKLTNETALKKARVHPYTILLAQYVYSHGRGEKGSLTWEPNSEIVATLDSIFYQSFGLVEPTNKRILIALDISASMGSRLQDGFITCREAASVMAMVTIRAEKNCDVVGFHTNLIPLDQFKDTSMTLKQVIHSTSQLGFGATDCSKPMTWARHHKKEYDAFIIYTDSETNSHRVPPYMALDKYREKMNIPTAKLIVVAMTSFGFSIARPDDLHMLDLVGFDSDTPGIISDFLTGGLD